MRTVTRALTRSISDSGRALRRRAQLTVVAVAAAALLSGCMLFMRPPADLDYARTRTSESGLYRASIRPDGDSIPQGRLQRWTLHLETVAGVPVDSARIAVDGGMPQHGHGLPTRPRVSRSLGHGAYEIEGVRFNMGGWWEFKLFINAASGSDVVTFNLAL